MTKRSRKYEDERNLREIVDDARDCHGYEKQHIGEAEYLESRRDFKMTDKEILASCRLMKGMCSKEFVRKHPRLFKCGRKS